MFGLFGGKNWNVVGIIFERPDLYRVNGNRGKGGSAKTMRDVLDVSDILPGSVDSGHEAVSDGFVRFMQSGADTLVQVDYNGGADHFQTLAVLKGVVAATLHPDEVLAV